MNVSLILYEKELSRFSIADNRNDPPCKHITDVFHKVTDYFLKRQTVSYFSYLIYTKPYKTQNATYVAFCNIILYEFMLMRNSSLSFVRSSLSFRNSIASIGVISAKCLRRIHIRSSVLQTNSNYI